MPAASISKISTRNVIVGLAAAWIILWGASVAQDTAIWATGTGEKIWLLDVDSEGSLYTWYSTLLLSIAAYLALLLSLYRAKDRSDHHRYWRAIGVIFLFLSADELLSLHEKLSGLLSSGIETSGAFTFAWVLVALPLVALLAVIFAKFILNLPRRIGIAVVLSGVMFVSGAVGMEMITGIYISGYTGAQDVMATPTYRVLTNIEEGLEAFGVIVFIYALLAQGLIYFPNIFTHPLSHQRLAGNWRVSPEPKAAA